MYARLSSPRNHYVLGSPMKGPFEGFELALVGMGCFWGAERRFWSMRGVVSTAVGYSGGNIPHPTYRQVCTTDTGHAEVVRVVFDPAVISYERILATFWENHDPRQRNYQGRDYGPQYRSVIFYYNEEQRQVAGKSRSKFQSILDSEGKGKIVTEICEATEFYFAEKHHQQYLAKHPEGYCGVGGVPGVCYPYVSQLRGSSLQPTTIPAEPLIPF